MTGFSHRIGTLVYNSRGLLLTNIASVISYLQPSRYSPLIYPPSGAGSLISFMSNLSFTNSNSNSTMSMAYLYLRAKFCLSPVKNACGKKNPLIQKHIGVPSFSHLFRKSTRAVRSDSQFVRGLTDRNPQPFSSVHERGTSLRSMRLPKSSKFWFITILPLLAFMYSFISSLITLKRVL